VEAILAERAGGPRVHRNMVVFVAADTARLDELRDATRSWLAWRSVLADKVELELVPQQERHAQTQVAHFDETVAQRIGETFVWLLAPRLADPKSAEIEWEVTRVTGADAIPVRVSRKLRNEEGLVTEYAGTRLRLDLDRVPLWRGDHVGTQQLWSDYTNYLYLPRLRDRTVLIRAIENGIAQLGWVQDTFGYADAYDEGEKRYRGLVAGSHSTVLVDGSSVVVKPKVAKAQLDIDTAPPGEAPGGNEPEGDGPVSPPGGDGLDGNGPVEAPAALPTRFFGSVGVDATRLGRDAGQIADEIVSHLVGLVGADVEVTIEIAAKRDQGFAEDVTRTVNENARTLKFEQYGFEDT
jgi:hypothetical protein